MSDYSDITADRRPASAPAATPQNNTVGTKTENNAVQGTVIRIKICVVNWDGEEDSYDELDCGAFEIDACDFSGPPDKISIKAVSTPVSSSMRNDEKTRSKEDTTLKEWAQTIADDAGLQLMYEVESDIQLDRVDQVKKSDMSFLQELCTQYGVALKVTNDTIVLFEESVYEAKDVIDSFDKSEYGGGGRLLDYSFSQDTGNTVSKAVSSYKDPKSGQLIEATFEPPEPPATGQTAITNARPGDLRGDNYRNGEDTASEDPGGTFDTGFKAFNDTAGDFEDIRADRTDNAYRQAKAIARERNKNEWRCTLKMVGHIRMVSGVNIQVTGFGVYSGKYTVYEATHKVGGAYETTVKARRVLVGY